MIPQIKPTIARVNKNGTTSFMSVQLAQVTIVPKVADDSCILLHNGAVVGVGLLNDNGPRAKAKAGSNSVVAMANEMNFFMCNILAGNLTNGTLNCFCNDK